MSEGDAAKTDARRFPIFVLIDCADRVGPSWGIARKRLASTAREYIGVGAAVYARGSPLPESDVLSHLGPSVTIRPVELPACG